MLRCKYDYKVISPAEPGQVENLTASFVSTGSMFDSNTRMYTLDVDITWDDPTNPNGVITSYEVTVSRTNDSNDIVYTNTTLKVTSVTTSMMVLPFTNYTVTVAASTSAGQGEAVTIIIESPEAGNDIYLLPNQFCIIMCSFYYRTRPSW